MFLVSFFVFFDSSKIIISHSAPKYHNSLGHKCLFHTKKGSKRTDRIACFLYYDRLLYPNASVCAVTPALRVPLLRYARRSRSLRR